MPVVKALEPAPGRLGGFVLEVDEAVRFRVSEDLCQRRGLQVGDRLSTAELESLARDAGDAEAMERAVHYLSYRPRTCREVRRYLGKHDLSGHADAAIDRCLELGYLNDEAYARAFVRERIRLKPRGRPRLVSELLGRGVDRDTAERAVETTLDEEGVTEAVLLREVALRRVRSLRSLDPPAARRRLSSFLGRRGFRTGAIREVVLELLPDQPDGGES
jgi:regulatory protein